MPAGSESMTTMGPGSGAEPVLVTQILKRPVCPTIKAPRASLRSVAKRRTATGVVTLLQSLVVYTSSDVRTHAVLVMGTSGRAVLTCTVIATLAVAPTSSAALRLQVTR